MEPFTTLTAVAAPIDGVNVDTDQIIPARFIKSPRDGGYGRFLFHDERFADDGSEIPGFVLNRAAYRAARILVAGRNFGCGSSREGAVYALADHGVRALVAPSFGDIFFNNCLKNSIVPARLPEETCAALRSAVTERPGTMLTVDLERSTVIDPTGTAYSFAIDDFWRELLLKGVDELGLTRALLGEIAAFEQRYEQSGSLARR